MAPADWPERAQPPRRGRSTRAGNAWCSSPLSWRRLLRHSFVDDIGPRADPRDITPSGGSTRQEPAPSTLASAGRRVLSRSDRRRTSSRSRRRRQSAEVYGSSNDGSGVTGISSYIGVNAQGHVLPAPMVATPLAMQRRISSQSRSARRAAAPLLSPGWLWARASVLPGDPRCHAVCTLRGATYRRLACDEQGQALRSAAVGGIAAAERGARDTLQIDAGD